MAQTDVFRTFVPRRSNINCFYGNAVSCNLTGRGEDYLENWVGVLEYTSIGMLHILVFANRHYACITFLKPSHRVTEGYLLVYLLDFLIATLLRRGFSVFPPLTKVLQWIANISVKLHRVTVRAATLQFQFIILIINVEYLTYPTRPVLKTSWPDVDAG